jgi:hypothetical protein
MLLMDQLPFNSNPMWSSKTAFHRETATKAAKSLKHSEKTVSSTSTRRKSKWTLQECAQERCHRGTSFPGGFRLGRSSRTEGVGWNCASVVIVTHEGGYIMMVGNVVPSRGGGVLVRSLCVVAVLTSAARACHQRHRSAETVRLRAVSLLWMCLHQRLSHVTKETVPPRHCLLECSVSTAVVMWR